MSTLTSADLHVKRSSTRLHAPPGGVSSLSFGCGGLGATEPNEVSNKYECGSSQRFPGQHISPTVNFNSLSDYWNQSNDNSPQQHRHLEESHNQQQHQFETSYKDKSDNNNHCKSKDDNPDVFQIARPPSSKLSSCSSIRSISSSESWGSQPPLTSSKRDQNWERKRRIWLMHRKSNNNGDRPTSSFISNNDLCGEVCDDSINPSSPLSKLVQQHELQQQQQQLLTPYTDNQRLDSSRTSRSSSGTTYLKDYQSHPHHLNQQKGKIGNPAGGFGFATAPSTASSTKSGRRQPPGGQCQWSFG
ncbi:uncharacterized protein PHALS_12111 [Plasmopara halstedii]|uniref:Uncharacterized protein n=1 Tax=Plasmopara halstedii TaxID=4781 RepID=A0A0P1AKJ7_PLAHL|nr:uncharacterized protein PHALS_12111 [Plasmopara halstedii]CEG41785.1 hypothetical protein PHALS_12111 [Plasmopara halstedii]|eukprot:XP_024578154.1 hypothetical protein PHALS_12111 [Plasmopara halstedii]